MNEPTPQDHEAARAIVDSSYFTNDDVTGGYDRDVLIRSISVALSKREQETRERMVEAIAGTAEADASAHRRQGKLECAWALEGFAERLTKTEAARRNEGNEG